MNIFSFIQQQVQKQEDSSGKNTSCLLVKEQPTHDTNRLGLRTQSSPLRKKKIDAMLS